MSKVGWYRSYPIHHPALGAILSERGDLVFFTGLFIGEYAFGFMRRVKVTPAHSVGEKP